ncbi:MAG TPA: CsgG/HfaB family protein [Phycisphaerales bacterium]|nr:CsgG/HfaB family protein [Phycisphaerales bacterium]HRQ75003.1 CsgG/HfaB family protein [Phycisphaerales bacterium]
MRLHRVAAFCAVLVCAGCSGARNPWTYTAPPTTVAMTPAAVRSAESKMVVVVGQFADPSRAPNYSTGVGRCMSDAFSRALMNEGSFDVWINPQLSRDVERIVGMPSSQQGEALSAVSRANPRVDYVITGKVTDFYHTTDLPDGAARKGWFLGKRREAVVAVDLRIVEMRTGRIVGADHIKATASAGSAESRDLYNNVALDSYVFWSTPLGRASKDVVESGVQRAARVIPPRLIDPQVTHLVARRRVSIIGGTNAGLVVGNEYYIVHMPTGATAYEAMRDPHTNMPLRVRIESATNDAATGWLLGEKPLEVDIRGSILRVNLPQPVGVAGGAATSTTAATSTSRTASATDR